jgi:hypothetical protein
MLSYTLRPVFRFTSDFGGGGGRYFCRFYLAVLMAKTIINKYRIMQKLHFDLKQICRNECILIPPNSVATAAMPTTDR